MRFIHAARVALSLIATMACLVRPALAAPPPPPGGHIGIHQGGNNPAGYPPLNQPVSVPHGDPATARLEVRCTPNPFSSGVEFQLVTQPDERGSLRVFAVNGRLVRGFAIDPSTQGGARRIAWNGRDQRGRRLTPGMYLYRVELGERIVEGKVLHIR